MVEFTRAQYGPGLLYGKIARPNHTGEDPIQDHNICYRPTVGPDIDQYFNTESSLAYIICLKYQYTLSTHSSNYGGHVESLHSFGKDRHDLTTITLVLEWT